MTVRVYGYIILHSDDVSTERIIKFLRVDLDFDFPFCLILI